MIMMFNHNYEQGKGLASNPGPLSLSNSLKRPKNESRKKTGENGGEREGLVQYDAEVG